MIKAKVSLIVVIKGPDATAGSIPILSNSVGMIEPMTVDKLNVTSKEEPIITESMTFPYKK